MWIQTEKHKQFYEESFSSFIVTVLLHVLLPLECLVCTHRFNDRKSNNLAKHFILAEPEPKQYTRPNRNADTFFLKKNLK